MNRQTSFVASVFLVLLLPAVGLAQTIAPLERAAGPCTNCAPDGWVLTVQSPDVVVGDGAWPGGTWTVSAVAGGPLEGSNMTMILSGGSTREAISTTVTGLTSGASYALSIFYQGATLTSSTGVFANGSFTVTVDGATTSYPTSDGDAWTEASVTFAATGPTATVVLSILDLGTGVTGGFVVADGVTIAVADSDLDGDPDHTDCAPMDGTIYTGAPDVVCDGVDNDCDMVADDGFIPTLTMCGVGVCASTGMTTCTAGTLGDSCTAGTPAASDPTCDGVDDDCDGTDDEDYASLDTTCGVGACGATGATSCIAGSVADSCTAGTPAASDPTCDGVDDDCDGTDDEDYASLDTTCGVGECGASGSTSCASGAPIDSCTPGTPAVDDATCDTFDDDCDGMVDEDGMCGDTDSGVPPMTDGGGIGDGGGDGGGIGEDGGDGGDGGGGGRVDDGGCSCRVQARGGDPAVPALPLALSCLLGVAVLRRRHRRTRTGHSRSRGARTRP